MEIAQIMDSVALTLGYGLMSGVLFMGLGVVFGVFR